jgi:hypothetical protein
VDRRNQQAGEGSQLLEPSAVATASTCAGTTRVLPGATVQVTSGQTAWTLTTDTSGKYVLWLHAASRLSVITSLPGLRPQADQVQVSAGTTTTHDVRLNQA